MKPIGCGCRYGNIGRRIAKLDSTNPEPALPSIPDREERLDAWLALTGQSPGPEGPVRLPMLTGSMLPDIPVGAVLEVEKVPGEHCRPGDVVVYRVDDRLVAHRILWRIGLGSRRFFFEKGDTNERGGWIRSGKVCGLVTAIHAGPDRRPLPRDICRARANRAAVLREWVLRWPRRLRDLLRPAPR